MKVESMTERLKKLKLPVERVNFDTALKIISDNYGRQSGSPWRRQELREILNMRGGTGNIWADDDLIWVFNPFFGHRKKPVRCLQIEESSP